MNTLESILNSFVQFLVLGLVPFLVYAAWQKRRHRRTFRESASRAGLTAGPRRYLAIGAAVAAVLSVGWTLLHPSMDALVRPGSAHAPFRGLGFGGVSVVMALAYGVVKTGLTEELIFRGLLLGSLARRMAAWKANLVQTVIFLMPHVLVIAVAPEFAWALPAIFFLGLFLGWLRLRSGSILASWLVHAAVNITTTLVIATTVPAAPPSLFP